MMEKLKNFPFILFFAIYLSYLGFQFYEFNYAADGQVEMNALRIKSAKDELDALKKRLSEGQKFMKTIDLTKEELRAQAKKLSEYQGVLSEGLDVASLIKILLMEAKRITLKVDRIEPGRKQAKEYYIEQEFKIDFKGSYSQVVLFAQRISQLQRVLRIESFNLKPQAPLVGSRVTGFLEGQFSIIAYQYAPSNEDTVARTYK